MGLIMPPSVLFSGHKSRDTSLLLVGDLHVRKYAFVRLLRCAWSRIDFCLAILAGINCPTAKSTCITQVLFAYVVVGACPHLDVGYYAVGVCIPFRLVSNNFCSARSFEKAAQGHVGTPASTQINDKQIIV